MYGKNAASSLFLPFFHLLYAAATNTTTAAAASVAAHSMKPSIHSLSLFHTSQQRRPLTTMYGRLFTYWQPVFIFLTFHSASRAFFNIALKIEIMEHQLSSVHNTPWYVDYCGHIKIF